MQVAEGAGGLGDRDAIAAGRNCGSEGARAVDLDAGALFASTRPRKAHVDKTGRGRKQSPHACSTPVADYSAIAQGEDGGNAASFEAEIRVPDGVNTAMNTVKPTSAGSLRDHGL